MLSDPSLKKKKGISYIDDTMLQIQNKTEMFDTIREYHFLLRKANLKAALDKTFFFLRKVKFLGHVVSKDGLSQIASRNVEIKKLKSPESKAEVPGVLVCHGILQHIYHHVSCRCKMSI